jgi:predicted deacylase
MNYALKSFPILGPSAGPHLLVTGGVHGDEYEPMAAIWQLIRELPPSRIRGRITFVPCVNEPAFRLVRRTAEDGLDLARTCPGRPDGSVTEQIADALSALIRSADYYVDLHTGGVGLQVYPLSGFMLHPRAEVLQVQRRMASAMGLPLIWGTDPSLNGRSLSVARDAGIPAIYAEYLGGGSCNPLGVAAYVRGCKNVLSTLGMTDEPPLPQENNPLVVEDSRPNSGYMQINHPAPCDGLFQPAVQLGQRVERGQTFGMITDLQDGQSKPVFADHSGCVIVLRSLARVVTNDSLGVVLETDGTLPVYTNPETTTKHTKYTK